MRLIPALDFTGGSIAASEGVVEYYAELYHIRFLAMGHRAKKYGGNQETFDKLYDEEVTHALRQVKKLLRYFGMDTPNDLFREENKGVWKERGTHAFSYFVLRTVCMLFGPPPSITEIGAHGVAQWFIRAIRSPLFEEEVANVRISTSNDLRMTKYGDRT